MKLFKKIDNYLLRFYPGVWVTRVHSFLPIGLGVMLLIILGNLGIGWNPKDKIPSSETIIFLLIIPVLIYLVYWFIFQSRYNVVKSGGKVGYGGEYLSYFSSVLVFGVAYFIILSIPLSNELKVKNAVTMEQLIQDVENLDNANSIVNDRGSFIEKSNGTYQVYDTEFNANRYNNSDDNLTGGYFLTKREVLERIEKYVESYNRYTYNVIDKSPQIILSERLENESNYKVNKVIYKINKIRRIHFGKTYSPFNDEWFWMVSLAVIGWLSLVIWIFKQMNLRHFVIGFISICLTPLFTAIMGAVLFGLFPRGGEGVANFGLIIIVLCYVLVAALIGKAFVENRLNQSAYVLAMFLQFWLPLLPFYMYLVIAINRSPVHRIQRDFFGIEEESVVFWACVFVGIMSITFFKPVYAKFRSLPMKN